MPKKGENIYKRKDGRWEGRYIKSRTISGKIVYGYVYAKTYREVKLKLHNAVFYSDQPLKPTTYNTELFSSIAMEWFESIQPHIKESTQNKYLNLLKSYILPEYGNLSLDNLTYDFISEQCDNLLLFGGSKGTGLSPKTVTDALSVIRSILKFSIRQGKKVPCDGSKIQVKRVQKTMRILSKTEQKKLCQYLYLELDSYNIGILLCLFTGLRVGEICALRWEDVSFSDQTIHVHSTLQRVQDKSNSEKKTKIVITPPKTICSVRTIPIPDTLMEILVSYKGSSFGYLLSNSDSKYVEPRTMQNRFKQALERSGIEPANFHSLRHTFATRCIELGFDVKSLSEILGHSTVNITMNRYVHPTLELKKENMQKLSSLLTVN